MLNSVSQSIRLACTALRACLTMAKLACHTEAVFTTTASLFQRDSVKRSLWRFTFIKHRKFLTYNTWPKTVVPGWWWRVSLHF